MKKIYKSLSLIAFVAVCSNAMAQAPTITSVAIPQIGYTYNMMSDTAHGDVMSFTVSAGSASSQTWNYATTFGDSTYSDPAAFVAPSAGTGASNFPGSNMATQVPSAWVFLVGNTSGLFEDGINTTIQGTNINMDFNPNPTHFAVPYTYTSTPIVNDYAGSTTATISGFPVTISHRGHRVITADAFGTLTTPTGTYANTLRLKTYETISDSASSGGFPVFQRYDTTTNYSWMQNSSSSLLMSIDLTSTGSVKKAQYLQSLSFGVATVSAPSASLNAFPNPTSAMTYLTYENKTTGMVNLTLTDLTGKQVAVLVNEQQNVGPQTLAINTAALHLSKGLYFLQLSTSNTLRTTKLAID